MNKGPNLKLENFIAVFVIFFGLILSVSIETMFGLSLSIETKNGIVVFWMAFGIFCHLFYAKNAERTTRQKYQTTRSANYPSHPTMKSLLQVISRYSIKTHASPYGLFLEDDTLANAAGGKHTGFWIFCTKHDY